MESIGKFHDNNKNLNLSEADGVGFKGEKLSEYTKVTNDKPKSKIKININGIGYTASSDGNILIPNNNSKSFYEAYRDSVNKGKKIKNIDINPYYIKSGYFKSLFANRSDVLFWETFNPSFTPCLDDFGQNKKYNIVYCTEKPDIIVDGFDMIWHIKVYKKKLNKLRLCDCADIFNFLNEPIFLDYYPSFSYLYNEISSLVIIMKLLDRVDISEEEKFAIRMLAEYIWRLKKSTNMIDYFAEKGLIVKQFKKYRDCLVGCFNKESSVVFEELITSIIEDLGSLQELVDSKVDDLKVFTGDEYLNKSKDAFSELALSSLLSNITSKMINKLYRSKSKDILDDYKSGYSSNGKFYYLLESEDKRSRLLKFHYLFSQKMDIWELNGFLGELGLRFFKYDEKLLKRYEEIYDNFIKIDTVSKKSVKSKIYADLQKNEYRLNFLRYFILHILDKIETMSEIKFCYQSDTNWLDYIAKENEIKKANALFAEFYDDLKSELYPELEKYLESNALIMKIFKRYLDAFKTENCTNLNYLKNIISSVEIIFFLSEVFSEHERQEKK
ncbi:MAG: hypothetical protein N4A49_14900 [Marinifilaceae bacterium]|jgi:hypothetical protein|nr:hypothetical protein [Marinifilaceae bacterium]